MIHNNILLIFLALVLTAFIVYFQYFYKKKSKSKFIYLLSFLRFIAIFSLLLLLINPKFKSQQLIDIPPILNVLVDNSSSITYAKQDQKVNKFINDLKNNTETRYF
jgi:predicted PurR-regulated permease PerM